MNYSATFEVSTRGDREIVITRLFNARRELVWEAMVRPELIRRWLMGPPGWTMTVCDNDPVPGGRFRWAWSGPDGNEIAMLGIYRDVSAPGRLVRSERFDVGCEPQAGEQIGTLALDPEGAGRTRLTLTVLYPSQEARDAAIASGMTAGPAAGYDRLDEILAGAAA